MVILCYDASSGSLTTVNRTEGSPTEGSPTEGSRDRPTNGRLTNGRQPAAGGSWFCSDLRVVLFIS